MNGELRYTIRSFDWHAKLILETTHSTDASKNIEIETYRARMLKSKRIWYVDVFSHTVPYECVRIYNPSYKR